MTGGDGQAGGDALPPVGEILGAASFDSTGVETFVRYRWQTKLSVWQWLTCLAGGDQAPLAVVCEHVEDIVIVLQARLRCCQAKTRDRGSWTAATVCSAGHGIDALIRAYLALREQNGEGLATFELWLEGPMGTGPDTVAFFHDPTSASTQVRQKLVGLGLPQECVDDFLTRLDVRTQQPSRPHIDAVIQQYIGVLWPALSTPERADLYRRLLDAAETAQADEPQAGLVARAVAEALRGVDEDGQSPTSSAADLSVLGDKVLSRELLASIVPPLPSAAPEELLARVASGQSASALELKMRTAGVGADVITRAQNLRAEAELDLQLLRASRVDAEEAISRLAEQVVVHAELVANSARVQAVANPAIAARPGDYITTELLTHPTDLAQLDADGVFAGNGFRVFGLLCQESDRCRYGWRPQ